jgi:hypothetical protein
MFSYESTRTINEFRTERPSFIVPSPGLRPPSPVVTSGRGPARRGFSNRLGFDSSTILMPCEGGESNREARLKQIPTATRNLGRRIP